MQRAVRRRRSRIRPQRPRPHPDRPTLSFSVAVTSRKARGGRLKRGLFAAKHIAPSQRRGGRARAQAFVLMAAPIGAIQAESQRAAAAGQPLCSWRFFGVGLILTSPSPNTENLFAPPLPQPAASRSRRRQMRRYLSGPEDGPKLAKQDPNPPVSMSRNPAQRPKRGLGFGLTPPQRVLATRMA